MVESRRCSTNRTNGFWFPFHQTKRQTKSLTRRYSSVVVYKTTLMLMLLFQDVQRLPREMKQLLCSSRSMNKLVKDPTDSFYAEMAAVLLEKTCQFLRFVVDPMHSLEIY